MAWGPYSAMLGSGLGVIFGCWSAMFAVFEDGMSLMIPCGSED